MTLSEEELVRYENEIRAARVDADESKVNQMRQDIMLQEQDKGMISEQLDVSEILNNMYYLLKGYVLTREEKTGIMKWTPPTNNDMIILSDYGVNYVLGAVQWYVNKNTLLSNYETEDILVKMEDFATTITDNIFMDYENMFCYPTLKDCQDEIEKRVKKKVDTRMFALKLFGKTEKESDVRDNILKEMEERIEHEMTVISQQKLKSKLKRFESIIRFVQDTVHSAYNRAWKGQERRTLREHIHITESKGGLGLVQTQPKFTMNPVKVFGDNK